LERIRTFEPSDGYYLAFSGGKDSVVIHHLATKAGVKFDAHYNMTTVDPPELMRFIRDKYPNVTFEKPAITMWNLIRKKKFPPTRIARYCCEHLKEGGGNHRTVMLGVRWAESPRRKEQAKLASFCQKKSKRSINPIIDWTDSEVWEYIRTEQIPYCSLYDEGFERLGCVLCPLNRAKNKRRDWLRWPGLTKAYIKCFNEVIAIRNAEGLPTTWKTGEEMFRWWIEDESEPSNTPRSRDEKA